MTAVWGERTASRSRMVRTISGSSLGLEARSGLADSRGEAALPLLEDISMPDASMIWLLRTERETVQVPSHG